MSETTTTNLPRHATYRYHTGLLVFGLVLACIGIAGLTEHFLLEPETLSLLMLGTLCTGMGIGLAVLGFVGRRFGRGVQVVNTSFDLIGRGRFAEAEKLLDHAEQHHKLGLIQRVAAVQRGLIAMRRGDLKAALVALDRGVEGKGSIFQRTQAQIQALNARGIRAFLRAASDDRKGARVDIDAVRGSQDALPQALARAALAEAILIERSGDREVLREHLAQHHDLLFDVTDRRERAIVRAFQRKLESTTTSVYRKTAKRDAEGEEPPLADWIAQVVPEAAPFVETHAVKEKTGEFPKASVVSPNAQKAITDSRKKAAKTGANPVLRMLVLWALLIAAFLVIWQNLAPNPNDVDVDFEPEPNLFWTDNLPLLAGTFVGVFALLLARRLAQVAKARKQARTLFHALTLSAKGEVAKAHEELTKLASSRFALVSSNAHLALANQAERAGDLNAALKHTDEGLARLSQYAVKISASDILLPDLLSERAFVLAAMDRPEEAEAELASLPPAYPYMSRALFRVRLVGHARSGDLKAASALAEQAGLDLPLTSRDELLTDVVRAATTPEVVGAVEIARIRRELRSSPKRKQWLETVAPKALAAFEHASEETSAAQASASTAEAEQEAHAEEEAALVQAQAVVRHG